MPNKFPVVMISLFFLAPTLSAAIAEWKSFDEKVAEADAIIRGKLISSESRRDSDGRWIRTWSTFGVSEVLKGDGGGTVVVVTPGGEIDGIHQRSAGSPVFEQGREQVLFLERASEAFVPLYLDQGVYDVTSDGSRMLVRPTASNLVLFDDQAGRVVPVEATRTLEAFRADLRASLERERGRIARSGSIEGPEREKQGWSDFITDNAVVLSLLSIGLIIALITWIRRQ